MKTLSLYPIGKADHLASPEATAALTVDTPALRFFTDFKQVEPLVLESHMSALDAKRLMQTAHVRMKFVLNESGQFIGIITSEDLIERKLVQKVSEGSNRNEIGVTDLMTPRSELKALDYQEVAKVTISEVIHKLKDSGEQHCLVVARESNEIRGIFSASDISRKLHLPIDIQAKSDFYKVFSETA
ncbi:CBS domain-containing protein [Congregibacter sp.]|uniref:CBS domain-containing protein n=1 Tax=Congregibacter sp. TaxID=2744308 RepID=UPI003F6AC687